MIIHNLLFKKIIVNRIKLRRSRQEIINHNSFIKKLKNVRRKNIIIYDIYESQEFIAVYYYKKVELKTSEMIKIAETVQVQDTIHFKKKRQNKRFKQKNDYMKKKKEIYHNILKKNESLSANQKKFNAMLKIQKNKKEQFFINKNKFQISNEKIDDIIKNYHDDSLQKHLNVNKILQFLRRDCQFFNMRARVETYIKKCFNC